MKTIPLSSQEIPFDIVIEILTRLPPKSLMRFKSISKLLSSLICSQYFTNLYLKHSSSSPRLYMRLHLENKEVLLSSSSSTMSTFIIDQELTIPALKGYYISQAFRGLMCFVNGPSAQIYNTSTRQLVLLPNIKESNMIAQDHTFKSIMFHIGHDHVHDQYKVICTNSINGDIFGENLTYISEHWILTLGRDVSNQWRKIPCRSLPHHLPVTVGLTINGHMYYLARVHGPDPVLVSIDLISEEMGMCKVSKDAYWFNNTHVIEYGGRVALLCYLGFKRKGVMKIWNVVDEEKNLWSSKILVLDPSQTHMVNSNKLKVQGTTRHGEVILVPHKRNRNQTGKIISKPQLRTLFYVFIYNIQKNHLRKVEIKESSNQYLTNNWHVIGFDDVDNLMYL